MKAARSHGSGKNNFDLLKNPSLLLTGVTTSDEGRYWCMVAEWSGRQQEGTDADSIALLSSTLFILLIKFYFRLIGVFECFIDISKISLTDRG